MARNPYTGEKDTATKPERRHKKVVAEAIRKHGNGATNPDATPMSPSLLKRFDSTFDHMHRANERYRHRRGW